MSHEYIPFPPDNAGIVSWVQFGDLHMEGADGRNYDDLCAWVDKVNTSFVFATSFVLLPGDNANEGRAPQYELVRSALDRLRLPWRAIVGDHDVHERSFRNFLHYLEPETYYSFQVGHLTFFALNAFSEPEPSSFELSPYQLDWLDQQAHDLPETARAVLLLHCYPSDLKQGGERLRELLKDPRVLLVAMGHTHYNEVANDGDTLYTATRSTGQIEEGPVGFSVTNVDGAVVSWSFLPLDVPSLVMITSPADERFATVASTTSTDANNVASIRAKFWGDASNVTLRAAIAGEVLVMSRIGDSQAWQADLLSPLRNGVHEVVVTAQPADGDAVSDSIRIRVGAPAPQARQTRDQDNALPAWPERGLLGTQLGPNKNGKKW